MRSDTIRVIGKGEGAAKLAEIDRRICLAEPQFRGDRLGIDGRKLFFRRNRAAILQRLCLIEKSSEFSRQIGSGLAIFAVFGVKRIARHLYAARMKLVRDRQIVERDRRLRRGFFFNRFRSEKEVVEYGREIFTAAGYPCLLFSSAPEPT